MRRRKTMPGLDITEETFRELSAKEQNTIIFKNTQEMKQKLDEHLTNFSYHKKVIYTLLGFIGTGFLILLNLIIN